MNPEMKIIREVNVEAEDFYQDAVLLGRHAEKALTARHRSQLTGLENIAETTFKTTDVFDYIKKQIARFRHWNQHAPANQGTAGQIGFGERLKTYLEIDLQARANKVATRLEYGETSFQEKLTRRHIYLLLTRQFIRQMIVEYEYQTRQTRES
jgi:hypothetical protein